MVVFKCYKSSVLTKAQISLDQLGQKAVNKPSLDIFRTKASSKKMHDIPSGPPSNATRNSQNFKSLPNHFSTLKFVDIYISLVRVKTSFIKLSYIFCSCFRTNLTSCEFNVFNIFSLHIVFYIRQGTNLLTRD